MVLAHAELRQATPAQNSIVDTLPSEVTLVFSEPVELRFSLFKVYKLDGTAVLEAATEATAQEGGQSDVEEHGAEGHPSESADGNEDAGASKSDAPSSSEQLRLNGLAGALVSRVLTARGDEAARADAGLATVEATSETVSLKLKPGFEPGTYVVMWRVLSIDTHTEQGYSIFTYRPAVP